MHEIKQDFSQFNMTLTEKEIGQRIARLRKVKGLSQEELAEKIGISRPSLTQLEQGNRKLDIMELQALAQQLAFSLDEFMSSDFNEEQQRSLDSSDAKHSKKKEERISIPTLQVPKFKNILLYILESCAGKPNVGETVLYKLLYFSDFNHYELYEEHLTGATYRKLPYGPVPQKLDILIQQMIEEKLLQRIKTNYHGYAQTRYLPLEKARLTGLKASEKEVIDRVIDQMSDWSATAISEYSHMDMPWMASKDGEVIDYELVFYRDTPYTVRNYGMETEEK